MPSESTPPVAAKRPHQAHAFGVEWIDDYYWLRERENPEVLAHIKAENAYTAAVLQHTESLQEQLYQELVGFVNETDQTAPAPDGAYLYYDRTIAGEQYPIHCRIAKAGGSEEILLDENELADSQPYFRMGAFKLSPDQQLLVFTMDTNGSERFNLFVKNLATGEIIDRVTGSISYDIEWAADNKTFFYITFDDAWRSSRLYRHTLGTPQSADVLIYEEHDQTFNLGLHKTRSGAFLKLLVKASVTNEEWLLPTDQPDGAFEVIMPRRHGIDYFTHHAGEYLYIQTNENAPNFRVYRIPLADRTAAAEELLPHNSDILIDRIESFAGYLVALEREHGLEQVRIVDLASMEQHRVSFPEDVYSCNMFGPHYNQEFATNLVRLSYSSLVTPPSTIDYDMAARSWMVVKQLEVPGYDPSKYCCERMYATASDGVQIPLSVVRPVAPASDGSKRLFLYGYGSYGATIEPEFSSRRLPLLERGFTYVIAHIRGGGEMGRAWWDAGKVLTKRNTFTDFIAAAEYLIAAGLTTPEQLVIKGRSAGGLLMGAVTVMRPDLFQAVIAGVPFVDVVNTSLDPTVPLVIGEYEEWGDPRIEEQFHNLRSYSPYDNTVPNTYPHVLATAGYYDPRVQYWEPAKWVQKLRDVKTNSKRALLKTEIVGGHAGPSGRYDYLRDIAFEYAFFLDSLGLVRG
jgi:oligopeptidase B